MRCDEARLQFHEAVRGGAPAAREHAGGCASCGAELKELERVDGALGGWSADPGPVDVWPAVRSRIGGNRLSWPVWATAAAALLLAAGVTWQISRPNPSGGPDIDPGIGKHAVAALPVAMVVDPHVSRHLAITPERAVPVMYAYIGGYDAALDSGSYDAWSDAALAKAAPSAANEALGLLVPPAYVPNGSRLQRVEPAIAAAEASWKTPFGDLTVLQTTDVSAPNGIQTIVGGGREIKVSRFESAGCQVTVVSEGLPWPELERIRRGFGAK